MRCPARCCHLHLKDLKWGTSSGAPAGWGADCVSTYLQRAYHQFEAAALQLKRQLLLRAEHLHTDARHSKPQHSWCGHVTNPACMWMCCACAANHDRPRSCVHGFAFGNNKWPHLALEHLQQALNDVRSRQLSFDPAATDRSVVTASATVLPLALHLLHVHCGLLLQVCRRQSLCAAAAGVLAIVQLCSAQACGQ